MDLQQIETNLGIKLPDNFNEYSSDTQTIVLEYLTQLNTIEKHAYRIAKDHLQSSFDIVHSNGYVQWIKNKEN